MSDEGYKVRGRQADPDGVGVLGANTATSGRAVGVEGPTESPEGYGLATADDARVGGELGAGRVRTEHLNGGAFVDPAGDQQGIESALADATLADASVTGFTEVRSNGQNNAAPVYVAREGYGTESTDAEAPTADDWRTGTVVEFTDTGDDSGNGTYLVTPDGSTEL